MLNHYCKQKVNLIEAALARLIPEEKGYEREIFDAMRYSLFAGGKRLRPILLMAAADAVGENGDRFLHVACGLEMIHTYSLIHDDLPAMDNDDYRRGKLTNHKVYGDGLAILAGDGLLTVAFETMLSQPEVEPVVLLKVIREIALAAGARGMIAGQALDLRSEGRKIDADEMQYIHRAKTGALFRAAIRSGALLAGANEQQLAALSGYADHLGLAFQITDDILDVVGTQDKLGKPIGSDERNHKATYVTLYSLEDAQILAEEAVRNAISALDRAGLEATVMRDLVRHLLQRDN
jgi:geranylgeranyl diphosphate synthase type II